MAKASSETLTLDGHAVTVSNPGKLYFADAKITKLELVQYYLSVALNTCEFLYRYYFMEQRPGARPAV